MTRLPDLPRLARLEGLRIDTIKGLGDIFGAAKAPVLKKLVVGATPGLRPADFEAFVGHLRYANCTPTWAARGTMKRSSGCSPASRDNSASYVDTALRLALGDDPLPVYRRSVLGMFPIGG